MQDNPSLTHMINGATGESFTNAQVLRRAVSLARALVASHCDAGRPTLLCVMKNTEQLVTLYYAAFFAGVKIFLLDPQSTLLELKHFMALVEPHLVVCDSDRLNDVRTASENVQSCRDVDIRTHDGLEQWASEYDSDPANFEPVAVSPDSCAVLLPTSGSTGLPKAAEITYRGLLAQLPSIWTPLKQFPRPTERLLFMSTAQWMTFTNFLTTCPVYQVTIIVTPDKTIPTVLRIIDTFKATWLLLVPSSATALSEQARAEQLTSLRNVTLTGAAPSAATLRRLATLAPRATVVNSYGMTETMGFVTLADEHTPFGSIGKIFNIFDYKLVDDDGKVVPRGTKGELYLKSEECVIKCYVKNEAAYNECATPDDWWKTGDVFTEDEHNNLHFVERKRFWFKYQNYHVSPEEVEAVIHSVEGVVEAVVGSSERGAAAAVVRRAGARVDRDDIHRAVNNALIEYKQLHGGIAFVESLPRTHSGKLHRADCTRLINQLIETGECC